MEKILDLIQSKVQENKWLHFNYEYNSYSENIVVKFINTKTGAVKFEAYNIRDLLKIPLEDIENHFDILIDKLKNK